MEREIIEQEIDLERENFEIVSEVDIDVEKANHTATVSIKRWDGSTKSVNIYDGEDGKDGNPGKDGENGKDGKDGKDGVDGQPGPVNTLTIGTVESGTTSSATITGTSPNQVLNLVLQKGDKGDPGVTPDLSDYVKKQTEYEFEGTTCQSNITTNNGIILEPSGTLNNKTVRSAVFLNPQPQYNYTESGFASILSNEHGVIEASSEFFSNAGENDSTMYFQCTVGQTRNQGIQMNQTQTKIINVPTPVNNGDAVNKKYVDDIVGEINTVLATLTIPGGGGE